MKTCPICNIKKKESEYDEYWSQSRNKYRLQGYCKDCKEVDSRKRAEKYYQDNRQYRLKYAEKYRNENKKKIRRYKKQKKRQYIDELHPVYVAEQASSTLDIPQRIVSQDDAIMSVYKKILKIKRSIRNAKK